MFWIGLAVCNHFVNALNLSRKGAECESAICHNVKKLTMSKKMTISKILAQTYQLSQVLRALRRVVSVELRQLQSAFQFC